MKNMCLVFFLGYNFLFSQTKIENLIIITTDGLRWQEVFNGLDSTIANNKTFNQGDSALLFKKYGAKMALESRKKLLPFFWNTFASEGQIYGNRMYDNKVDNANPYWFSYPGYSELFSGYVDTAINSNEYKANPNVTLLEFLNAQVGFKGHVAAFAAWDAFDRILNEKRAGFPVISGMDSIGGTSPDAEQILINKMRKNSYKPFGDAEYLDVFTHYGAMDYLKKKEPRVMYISYGETDEWAHKGQYRDYLDAANQVDQWINELWTYVQSHPKYKNKTALLFTVDHGRGNINKSKWTSHNNKISDSHEIWFALMGPGIPAKGELKTRGQLYQKQFAQTLANLLGLVYAANHPVADGINLK